MNYDLLIEQISHIHLSTQSAAARSVNHLLTLRNWMIGAYLFEYEQNGEDRTTYGDQLLRSIANDFTKRSLRGLSETNLKNCRTFAVAYPAPSIRQPLADELKTLGEPQLNAILPTAYEAEEISILPFPSLAARQTHLDKFAWQTGEYHEQLFRALSWSQLLQLARIDDPLKRAFYEIECRKSRWSRRELKRQIVSLPFAERLKQWLLEEQAQLQRAV